MSTNNQSSLNLSRPTRSRDKSMEWDDYDLKRDHIPPPSVLLGKGPKPDNRFHSEARPYAGPEDAINRWVEEGAEATGVQPHEHDQPYTTRAGRQIKTRRMYSPEDEEIRERELRAQARADALLKKRNEPDPDEPGDLGAFNPAAKSTPRDLKDPVVGGTDAIVRRSPRIAARAQQQAQAQTPEKDKAQAQGQAAMGPQTRARNEFTQNSKARAQLKDDIEKSASPSTRKANSKREAPAPKSISKSQT